MQLLSLLFSVLCFCQTGQQQERKIGTVAYICRFFILGTIILSLYSIVMCAFGMYNAIVQGLWAIFFTDLVIECMETPDQPRTLCCLPILIPSKYYPLVLGGIFLLISGDLSLLFGMIIGYLYSWGYMEFCKVGIAKAKSWETKFPFSKFNERRGKSTI